MRRLQRDGSVNLDWSRSAHEGIVDQAARLSRLIDRLLDVSRLESGTLSIGPKEIDLSALVARVVADARVRNPNHAVALNIPPALPAVADSMRIEQLLSNLLDNAVKFGTASIPIEVGLFLAADDTVEFTVRHHGPGIALGEHERIFERFHQGSGNAKRATSGLGLGLYICRQITEKHGGSIVAEFPPDGGARFVARIARVTSAEVES